ncbi:uncharacterized protein LOC106478823 [Limulus polyphemus]|uniref:Uncharacterized protein LOC106478823 n=1 Tax=Limulus polyphemus TaxID=6850 RepID=A0ABM1C618_LIMPO|nr:uncharacterized protein LOC106478823 [Limulus polyphemus]
MAATEATAERFEFREKFLFLLVFFLYLGLCANFYYTYNVSKICSVKPASDSNSNADLLQKQSFETRTRPTPTDNTFIGNADGDRSRAVDVSQERGKASQHGSGFNGKGGRFLRSLKDESSGYFRSHKSEVEPKDQWSTYLFKANDTSFLFSALGHRLKRHVDPHKRRHWRRSSRDGDVPSVEFFPKPQPTIETEGFAWVTSYSRIALPVLEEYCQSTREFCPPGTPGPPGNPGNPGLKGEKGDKGKIGFTGNTGPRGPQGFSGITGPIGPKGEPGEPGIPGLDGRDGLPGEPGLDGVPGRDGADGLPGVDGISGIPGTPGSPGFNGTDGVPGAQGPRGPPGKTGPTGLPGPRGRKGEPGTPGNPGTPGIQSWRINKKEVTQLLIPPAIVDIENRSTLIVQEGEHIRLQCSASGHPLPKLIWRRSDSKFIVLGNLRLAMVEGDRLNISRVTRYDMGSYLCIASNGVPPPDSRTTLLEVTFSPLIKIANPMIGTRNRGFAFLECYVEAFPQPINYWLYGDDRLLEQSPKYTIKEEVINHFTFKMTLNISYVERQNYGIYKCVSKNHKGKTRGILTVYEIDPSIHTTKPPKGRYILYGKAPPPRVVEPECPPCPECPEPRKCPLGSQGGKLTTVNVISISKQFNATHWQVLKPRTKDCLLNQVGKPVFQQFSNVSQGCWMKDPAATNPIDESKHWVTLQTEKNTLYEFADKTSFRNNNYTKKYTLPFEFVGNNHVVYNGSFYYNQEGTNNLIRFDLQTESNTSAQIVDAAYKDDQYLYTTRHSYMDLAADENGLWVIFAGNNTNNTLVLKFHPYSLQTEKMWNITLKHRGIGEMFIICGVLYTIDSVNELNTRISYAFDLYQNKAIDVNLDFTNPFVRTAMASYNARDEVIYTWDRGNQLVYPVRFATIDMGQPDPEAEKKDSKT